MASFFNITLDTLAPAGLTMVINDDALYTTSPIVTLTIGTADESTAGYQMKIWGILWATTEEDAAWETFADTKSVTLPGENGLKTVSIRLRDDVGNETAVVSDSITLDTAIPTITVTGPDKAKISKVVGFDTSIVNFISDVEFVEYKVCVVPSTTSTHDAGVVIPTDNGSINTSGAKGSDEEKFPADTNIQVTINGADLETASSGDGVKIVKIFVRNIAGSWSVA